MSSRALLVARVLAAATAGIVAAHLGQQMQLAGATEAIVPVRKPRRPLKEIGLDIVNRIGADNTTLVAAGVAFYAFLALFPAIAALVAVFGLVADPRLVEAQLVDLDGLLPKSALDLLLGVVHAITDKPRGQLGLAFAISTVIALWSARAGVTSLMTGLDIAYRNRNLRSFIGATAVGLALTIGSILVASALVVTIAGLPAIYAAAPAFFIDASGPLIAWIRWPAVALVMACSLAALYRIAPSQPLPDWHVFSAGTLTGTALWLLSSSAFSLYVSWSGSYDATYGSLAGAVVMMLWLWASSLAVLVGATVDAVVSESAA